MLDEKKHSRFERHGANLYYKMKLTLSEALCGTRKYIETLDKRYLDIFLLPGMYHFLESQISAPENFTFTDSNTNPFYVDTFFYYRRSHQTR